MQIEPGSGGRSKTKAKSSFHSVFSFIWSGLRNGKKGVEKWVVILSFLQRSYLMCVRELCVWTYNYEAESPSLHSEISWTDVRSHS